MTSEKASNGLDPHPTRNEPEAISNGLTTADEVARVLCITKRSVYEAARRGAFPCYRIQRQVRFDLEEVLAACKVKRFPVPPLPDDSCDEEAKAS